VFRKSFDTVSAGKKIQRDRRDQTFVFYSSHLTKQFSFADHTSATFTFSSLRPQKNQRFRTSVAGADARGHFRW
jgi:hypothetical protein